MEESNKPKIYCMTDAAQFLDRPLTDVKYWLSTGQLKANFKSPYFDDWFTLSEEAAKDSYERGLTRVKMISAGATEGETENWGKTLSWDQLFLFTDDLIAFRNASLARRLQIIKPDLTKFVLGDETFEFEQREAKIVKALYDYSKISKAFLHQTDIFNAADLTSEISEFRIDRLFRDKKHIVYIGNLILKGPLRATYRFADYFEPCPIGQKVVQNLA